MKMLRGMHITPNEQTYVYTLYTLYNILLSM